MGKKEMYGKSIITGIIPTQKDINAKQFQWSRCIDEWYSMSICKFKTCQCNVEVLSTPYAYRSERIYVVVSVHKKDGKELICFGNRQQVQNIINTYNLGSKKPEINW